MIDGESYQFNQPNEANTICKENLTNSTLQIFRRFGKNQAVIAEVQFTKQTE